MTTDTTKFDVAEHVRFLRGEAAANFTRGYRVTAAGLNLAADALERLAAEKETAETVITKKYLPLLEAANQTTLLYRASAEAAEARLAEAVEVIRAASLMANLCFNAKQMDRVPADIRKSMSESQETFDEARRKFVDGAPVKSPGSGN